MHQKCSNYALTNLLFGLCKFMWIIDLFVICFSPHPEALTRLSTFKMLRAKKRTPTPFDIFTFELTFESFKECKGASNAFLQIYLSKFNRHIFQTFTNFVINCGILAHFGKKWPKQVPWKLSSKPKVSNLTTDFKALVNVFKFGPSSFTYVMILFLKPYTSKNSIRFLANACPVVSTN